MDRILSLIFALLVVITSCKQNASQDNSTKTNNEKQINAVATAEVMPEGKIEKEGAMYQEIKPFVIFNENDTLFIPDTGKVSRVNKIGNEVYFYTLFESYQKETDFGKTSLVIRNNQNQLLWNLILEDYTQLAYNEKSILVVYFEKNLLKYLNHRDGSLIKSIKLNHNLSDGNEVLMTEINTYIKLINESDASTKDVLVINNASFEKKLLNLNLSDYYSLGKEGNKVFLESETDKKYLN